MYPKKISATIIFSIFCLFNLSSNAQIFTSMQNSDCTTNAATSIPASFNDFNNDSLPDLLVGKNASNDDMFYLNISSVLKIPTSNPFKRIGDNLLAITAADFDNDGYNDAFMAFRDSQSLLLNGGPNGLTLIQNNPLTTTIATAESACWVDYDNDGLADLFLTVGKNKDNILYKNIGNRNFIAIDTTYLTSKNLGYATNAAWCDFDDDGFQDVFIANQTANCRFFINNRNGNFSQLTTTPFDSIPIANSANWADYDNDGDMDLFVLGSINSNPAKIIVYENLGNRNFRINNNTGLSDSAIVSTGSSWGDYDNDGYMDLLIAQRSLYLPDNRIIFFKNNGNKTFSKISDSLTENIVEARAIANADMDNDGDLDVFVANENNRLDMLFQNNTTNQNWLKIRLSGIVSNKSAIGAKVRVFCALNGKNQILTRTVAGQTGWYSQNDLTVHFGLGNNSCVDSVIIYWPSGKQCVYKNLPVNRFYFIKENCNNISPSFSNLSLGNDTTLCYGNQIILSTGEPLTKWSNAQTGSSIVVKESGTYIATFDDRCLPAFADTIEIKISDAIPISIKDTGICRSDSLVFDFSSSPFSFEWSTGSNAPIESFQNAGTYSLTVTNADNCKIIDTFAVLIFNLPATPWNFTDTTVCQGKSITLKVGSYPYVRWNDGNGGTTREVSQSGIFSVELANTCGSIFDTVKVEQIECACALDMPNAFSPNGDNVNDLYGPVYDCPINDFSMAIFNRWGEKVFETDNIERMWDGTFMGKEQPIGVFLYKVNYKDSLKNEKKLITGKVTLIR